MEFRWNKEEALLLLPGWATSWPAPPTSRTWSKVPWYLAPEADRPEASPRQLDVFSLGALAYLLLTDAPPATSRVALVRKLRDGKGLQVAELLDGATSDLQELVRWSTHPDVTERLENVQDFLELLDGVEEELTRPEPEEVGNPLEARKGDAAQSSPKTSARLSAVSTRPPQRSSVSASASAMRCSTASSREPNLS